MNCENKPQNLSLLADFYELTSDMDEWIIRQLKNSKAPVDAWGVGIRLVTGGNDPALTGVYKIVAQCRNGGAFEPRIKISNQSEKITNPGIKNIMRFYNEDDQMLADLLYLEDEEEALIRDISVHAPVRFNHPATDYSGSVLKKYFHAMPLLREVMRGGRMIDGQKSLLEIREHRRKEMNALDGTYKRLLNPHRYKVSLSDRLKEVKGGLIKIIQSEYYY